MLTKTRRRLGGFLAALLVVGAVACGEKPTVLKEVALADVRVKANAGDAGAQTSLGVAYDKGEGVPQDYTQAAAWYRKAAEKGYAVAQDNLGQMYALGQGVPQDDVQSVEWWRKAADQGYAGAHYNLGVMYSSGQDGPQDYVESHKWHNLAASRASAEDQKQYAESRDAVAKLLTPKQLADAQQRATAWLAAFEKRGGR